MARLALEKAKKETLKDNTAEEDVSAVAGFVTEDAGCTPPRQYTGEGGDVQMEEMIQTTAEGGDVTMDNDEEWIDIGSGEEGKSD